MLVTPVPICIDTNVKTKTKKISKSSVKNGHFIKVVGRVFTRAWERVLDACGLQNAKT